MLIGPQNLPENITRVRERIARAAAEAGRAADSVTLLAAGKSQPPEILRALGLEWHFIGQVQSNKTRDIAEHFDWVHGVDRIRIAQRLSEQRPPHAPPLNVCIQVNLAGETSKGGAAAADVPQLAASIASLPRLKLRGLMCLPPAGQLHWFAQLRELRESLAMPLDTLSMGMSEDLEAAVKAGATIVRVGTALFGPRE